jgi:hypothetical protein
VLLANPAGENDAAGRQGDGCAERPFQLEDTFGVVAQGTMPEVGKDLLGLVEELMQLDEIFNAIAEFSHRAESMMMGVCHGHISVSVYSDSV